MSLVSSFFATRTTKFKYKPSLSFCKFGVLDDDNTEWETMGWKFLSLGEWHTVCSVSRGGGCQIIRRKRHRWIYSPLSKTAQINRSFIFGSRSNFLPADMCHQFVSSAQWTTAMEWKKCHWFLEKTFTGNNMWLFTRFSRIAFSNFTDSIATDVYQQVKRPSRKHLNFLGWKMISALSP